MLWCVQNEDTVDEVNFYGSKMELGVDAAEYK